MNNKQMAKKSKTRTPILSFILIVIGVFILAIFFKNISVLATKDKNYIETEARVVNHTYNNGVAKGTVIQYTVNEEIYQTTSNDHQDNLKTYGTVVRIKYNPDNPYEIIFPDRNPNLAMPITGLTFVLIGIIFAIRFFIKMAKNQAKKISITQDAPVYNNALGNNKNDKRKTVTNSDFNEHNGINDVVNNIDKNIIFDSKQEFNNNYDAVNYDAITNAEPFESIKYDPTIEIPNFDNYDSTSTKADDNVHISINNNYTNAYDNNYNMYETGDANISFQDDINTVSDYNIIDIPYTSPISMEPKEDVKYMTEAQKIKSEIEAMRSKNIADYGDIDDIPSFIPNIDEVNKRGQ